MKCPFQTVTKYTRMVTAYGEGVAPGTVVEKPCASKDAHNVYRVFATCHEAECPHFIENTGSKLTGGKK